MRRPVLALAIILIACGMTKSPKSFDPVRSPSHFVLEADVMVANKVSSGLAKGSYQAVFQSKDHVYYLGEPGALLMPNGTRVNGGIALATALAGVVNAALLWRYLRQRGIFTPEPGWATYALRLTCACAAMAVVVLGLRFWIGAWTDIHGALHRIGWLVLVATFGGYGLYYLCLARFAPARVTSVLYLSPPVTMLWATLLWGEPLTALMMLGTAITLAGVMLAAGQTPATT